MYSLFGQYGGEGFEKFDGLHNAHLAIWESPIIQIYKFQPPNAAVGQVKNAPFFPINSPFINFQRNRIYALQGYMWSNDNFPKSNDEAQQIVIQAGDQLVEKGKLKLAPDWGGLYILAVIDLTSEKIWLTCDYSGIIPLYYTVLPDGAFLFSTHSRPLAKIINAKMDAAGVIQQTSFGHPIGKRTLFQGIYRLNPGETLSYHVSNRQLNFQQADGVYSKLDSYASDEEAADALWGDYLNGCAPIARLNGIKGILLSGGFDTRLVVAGFKKFENSIASVTFGEPGNFEVEVARKVAKLSGTETIIHTPIQEYNLSTNNINHLIEKAEFANFPYCDTSADLLLQKNAISASTGYGGETILGGQGYKLFGRRWSQTERLWIALKRSLNLKFSFYDKNDAGNFALTVHEIEKFYETRMNHTQTFFSIELQKSFNVAREILKQDIQEDLSRIQGNQPETTQQIIERFWFEHHVLKHFGRQELTLFTKIPVILPMIYHPFMRRCSNLNPSLKVDHGIYLNLVKRNLSQFKYLPTSNIPISLSNPDILLWLSRAWRAKKDQQFSARFMKSKGNYHGQRFGWSNFDSWLRQANFFSDLPKYISWDLYSKDTIENKIQHVLDWNSFTYSGQEYLTLLTISQMLNI